jgi:hypothetical protein
MPARQRSAPQPRPPASAAMCMRMCLKMLSLLLFVWCGGAAVQAQDVTDNPTDYDQSLSRALEAHARGDHETARVFMERAHALEPSARTERGLGIVAFAQQKHLAAIRHLDAALASRLKPLPDDLRAATEELLLHAWRQVSRVELVIEPPEAATTIDGQTPDYYTENTLVLAPGPHTLSVRAGERPPQVLRFESRAGERRVLSVVVPELPAPRVVEKVVYRERASLRSPAEPTPRFYTRRIRRVAGVTGGGLAVAGGVLWGLGYARLRDVRADCRAQATGGCTRSEAEALYRHQNVGPLHQAGLVVGGAGVLLLVTMGALEIWQLRQRALSLAVGSTSITVQGRF